VRKTLAVVRYIGGGRGHQVLLADLPQDSESGVRRCAIVNASSHICSISRGVVV
jgi:hypothetical protein